MLDDKYTTNDELTYLRDLYMRRGADAIRQYAATIHCRVEWGEIDPAGVREEIRLLLDGQSLEQRLAAKGVVS